MKYKKTQFVFVVIMLILLLCICCFVTIVLIPTYQNTQVNQQEIPILSSICNDTQYVNELRAQACSDLVKTHYKIIKQDNFDLINTNGYIPVVYKLGTNNSLIIYKRMIFSTAFNDTTSVNFIVQYKNKYIGSYHFIDTFTNNAIFATTETENNIYFYIYEYNDNAYNSSRVFDFNKAENTFKFHQLLGSDYQHISFDKMIISLENHSILYYKNSIKILENAYSVDSYSAKKFDNMANEDLWFYI